MPRKTRKQKMCHQEREEKKNNVVVRKEFTFPVCCICCFKPIDTLTDAHMVVEYPTGKDAIAELNGESRGCLCKECVRDIFVDGRSWTYTTCDEWFKEEETNESRTYDTHKM